MTDNKHGGAALADTDLKALIAEIAREVMRLRSEMEIVLQNAEASASSYRERVETIHRVAIRALTLRAALSPAPVGADALAAELAKERARGERMREALNRMLLEFDFLVEGGHIPDVRDDMIFAYARAALEGGA